MNTLHVVYHLARADFLERARRSSFLLILAAAVLIGVLVNNGTLLVDMGSPESTRLMIRYRGEFSSAWIGMMTVLVTNLFLGVIGFYLVSDCIRRDIRTGVGQIIATTPVRRSAYLAGKWISNFAVFLVLELILAAAAVVMVLLRSRTALDPGALLMPFLAVALPNMALTAALAVFFETVPWLRGAIGNVVYFFMWMFSFWFVSGMALPSFQDPMGYNIFSSSLTAAARAAFPNETFAGISVGGAPGFTYKVFPWPGLEWTAGIVGGQWLWAVLGVGLILLSTTWFARFDPSREGMRRTRRRQETHDSEATAARKPVLHIGPPDLSPLVSKLAATTPFLGVLFAELRLLLKGRRWWWWLITAGLGASMFVSPFQTVKEYLLPVAWLWPLSIWPALGGRERKYNTGQMVFCSARPVRRQLPAEWLAGVLATALVGIAGAAVLLLHGDLAALAGWGVAVVFVPTLALALGVVSSGNRVFEVVYVAWWYIGLLQRVPGTNFTSDAPQVYLLAAAGLLLLSVLWRGRQLRAQN
jgi:hypothetical protein